MRGGEVEAGGADLLERRIRVKLGPVVHGDGPDRMGLGIEELAGALLDFGGRAPRELAEHPVARLPLDETQDPRSRLAGPEDRVALPVTQLRAGLHAGWTRRDRALAGESSR